MHIPFAFAILSWVVVSYVIYLFVTNFLRTQRHARIAKELKCEEPPVQRNPGYRPLPLGIDNITRAFAADKRKDFPTDQVQRIKDTGAITFAYHLLGSKNLFTADEKNIQTILATSFQDFDLGPNRRGNFWPLLGNGIFTQDGRQWEHSRAMMRPQFAREQVSDLDLEERHVQNMMRALDTSLQSDSWTSEVDLSVLFFRLTLDSACEFLFGESVDSQIQLMPGYQGEKKDDHDFAFAFDKAQNGLAFRARFADKYWVANPKGFKEACAACHEFIDHFVRLALSKDLREKELEKGTGKEKYVFLEALALHTRDPIELRSQLLHILLAGRDTTASHLGWLFMSLSKDPSRYKKLRNIVIDEFGTYDNPKGITFSKLKSCQYLQHCNNESLRLYPVVPVNGRFANKDTTLPRGGGKDGKSKIFVPAGTSVDYSVHAMHRREDIWGADAAAFNPERWEGRRVGWEFLPVSYDPMAWLIFDADNHLVQWRTENLYRAAICPHRSFVCNCTLASTL